MKTYSNVLLAAYVIIEILAIVLFVLKQLDVLGFILIVMSMSIMIGLYFWQRHKLKSEDKA